MFRHAVAAAMCLALLPAGAAGQSAAVIETNPLLTNWTTPFQVPPFGEIKPAHFLPAFEAAITQQRAEVEQIAGSAEPPTFANTIEALDAAGALLAKVGGVFNNLLSADTNDELQAINRNVAPLLTRMRDDTSLNPRLWARVRAVWDQREGAGLTPVQRKLLEDTYKGFVRSGASLPAAQQVRLRAINAELSQLGIKFSENLLHETNTYKLILEREEDLVGLPAAVRAAGAEAAAAAGLPGKWVYTLQVPSLTPFLQYSDKRELRRQILSAYAERCNRGDEFDNNAIVARTAALRAERAQLLGYKSHADFVIEENMAGTPARVYALLNQLWEPAREMAQREAAAQRELIRQDGGSFALEAADWR